MTMMRRNRKTETSVNVNYRTLLSPLHEERRLHVEWVREKEGDQGETRKAARRSEITKR